MPELPDVENFRRMVELHCHDLFISRVLILQASKAIQKTLSVGSSATSSTLCFGTGNILSSVSAKAM
jgi:hypothetical protein